MSAGDGSFAADVFGCCLSHVNLSAANPVVVTRLTGSNRMRPEIFSEKEKQRMQTREMDKKAASKRHCRKEGTQKRHKK